MKKSLLLLLLLSVFTLTACNSDKEKEEGIILESGPFIQVEKDLESYSYKMDDVELSQELRNLLEEKVIQYFQMTENGYFLSYNESDSYYDTDSLPLQFYNKDMELITNQNISGRVYAIDEYRNGYALIKVQNGMRHNYYLYNDEGQLIEMTTDIDQVVNGDIIFREKDDSTDETLLKIMKITESGKEEVYSGKYGLISYGAVNNKTLHIIERDLEVEGKQKITILTTDSQVLFTTDIHSTPEAREFSFVTGKYFLIQKDLKLSLHNHLGEELWTIDSLEGQLYNIHEDGDDIIINMGLSSVKVDINGNIEEPEDYFNPYPNNHTFELESDKFIEFYGSPSHPLNRIVAKNLEGEILWQKSFIEIEDFHDVNVVKNNQIHLRVITGESGNESTYQDKYITLDFQGNILHEYDNSDYLMYLTNNSDTFFFNRDTNMVNYYNSNYELIWSKELNNAGYVRTANDMLFGITYDNPRQGQHMTNAHQTILFTADGTEITINNNLGDLSVMSYNNGITYVIERFVDTHPFNFTLYSLDSNGNILDTTSTFTEIYMFDSYIYYGIEDNKIVEIILPKNLNN